MKIRQKGLPAGASKAKAGEIATIVTLVTFFVIGIASLVSSMALKKPQTTQTKAVDLNDTSYCTYCQGTTCVLNPNYDPSKGYNDQACTQPGLCTKDGGQCNNNTNTSTSNQCKDYVSKAAAKVDCDPKGYEPVPNINNCWRCTTSTSSLTPSTGGTTACVSGIKEGNSCTTGGEWCISCLGRQGPCNSDAGVGLSYQCQQNGKWKMTNQYGECNLTCAATSSFSTPIPGEPNPTKAPNLGGFHLTEEIYAEKSDGGVKFDVHVKFNSDGCDGDIMLYRDGTHVAGPNGWNIKMGPFDYNGQWAGSFTIDKGKSIAPTYRGTVDRCPKSSVTLQDTIQCAFSVDSEGNPNVSGTGCTAKNFTSTPPKAVPTPIPKSTSGPNTGWCLPQMADGQGHKYSDGKCYVCQGAYNTPVLVDDSKCSGLTVVTSITSPAPTTSSVTPVTTNGYCPDDGVNTKCSVGQPARDWVVSWMSCYSWQDKCWIPGPGSAQGDKTQLYPTPVPEYKTVEIDDGFESWSRWITHSQVCDDVGQKSFLGINGIIVKNCRDPEYLPGDTPGKAIFRYKKNTGVKTILCALGGNGSCIDLP